MRIAISLDDEVTQRLFAEHVGRRHHVAVVRGSDELRRLVTSGWADAAVVGVLDRHDLLWSSVLRDLGHGVPLNLVGVFEPTRPSLDETVTLAREIPSMGFVWRPDARLDWLIEQGAIDGIAPSFTGTLLECVHSLPLADVGRHFALLQALHPSLALDIGEQTELLGVGRRKLERWFQGPDICSPRRLQSVCAAAEAVYLRLRHHTPEREVAEIIGLLSPDGVPNSINVGREIRTAFGSYRDALRVRGVEALQEAIWTELRRARDPHPPARWRPSTRYWPAETALVVRKDDRVVLMDPSRGLEYPLDGFGADAWELMGWGATFTELASQLASRRGEGRHRTRSRLKEWLGGLLVLGLVHRGVDGDDAARGA
jgi:hypothetical protein